jgi:biotin operon repressor
MNVSRTVVSKYVQTFRSSGLRLEELEGMPDSPRCRRYPITV